jgi:hypothetical protein
MRTFISYFQFSIEHFDQSRLRKVSDHATIDDGERTTLDTVRKNTEGREDSSNDQGGVG